MMIARRLTLSGLVSLCVVVGALALGVAPALAASDPVVEEESVTNVASTSATLHAVVNPGGADTTYRFEDATGSGEFALVGSGGEPPTGAQGDAGEGTSGVALEVHVQGLSPSTSYRYRVAATSSVETVDGGEEAFTTQGLGGALVLPDARAWELVSPPSKKGALFRSLDAEGPGGDLDQASVAGNAVAYAASSPTEAEPQGYTNSVSVFSTRGAGGWSSQVITPPYSAGSSGPVVQGGGEYHRFSEDLSRAVVDPWGPFAALSPEAMESTPYLRTDYLGGGVVDRCESGCFQPLVTAADTDPGVVFGGEVGSGEKCLATLCGPLVVAGTPDLSHVIVGSVSQLTSTPTPETGRFHLNLYEWAGGGLRLVSVMPDGEAGEVVLAGQHDLTGKGSHGDKYAISEDGERLIFVSEEKQGGVGPVYLRENTMQPQSPIGPNGECTVPADACTVRLDVPQGEGTTGSSEPVYVTASRDASRIFFLDSGRLTSESSTSGYDLYEYDLNAPAGSRLTDLTADPNVGEPANVSGVLGTSEDGSYVYFLAAGALAPGAARNSECLADNGVPSGEATEKCNLYVRHDGVTTLIATSIVGGGAVEELARVSPDGRWLVFMSEKGLTGYDTRDAVTGQADEEVYLYDAEANRLVCASCNPSGARPIGGEAIKSGSGEVTSFNFPVVSKVPPWTPQGGAGRDGGPYYNRLSYQSRYLFNSGRLFFESNDALVPQDVNGARDVYEYEPPGVGNCTVAQGTFSERAGGCIDLISSGTSARQGASPLDLETSFVDANATGSDVFFLTAGQLLPSDVEGGLSLFDAHECTVVSPCPSSAAQSPPCDTEASCRPAPSPQPAIFGAPASSTFSGSGNPVSSSVVAVVKPGPRALTRAQKLARALKACGKRRGRALVVCERRARAQYGQARRRKVASKKKGKR